MNVFYFKNLKQWERKEEVRVGTSHWWGLAVGTWTYICYWVLRFSHSHFYRSRHSLSLPNTISADGWKFQQCVDSLPQQPDVYFRICECIIHSVSICWVKMNANNAMRALPYYTCSCTLLSLGKRTSTLVVSFKLEKLCWVLLLIWKYVGKIGILCSQIWEL